MKPDDRLDKAAEERRKAEERARKEKKKAMEGGNLFKVKLSPCRPNLCKRHSLKGIGA